MAPPPQRFRAKRSLLSEDQRKLPESSGLMTVNKHELNVFLSLLNSQKVEAFLQRDRCFVAIDNYILAAAFVFFKRANLTLEEYTMRNLWLALYLAHDAEEDEETRKWEMLPWALGDDWQHQLRSWEEDKHAFWRRIKYRVLVTKEQCAQVMALAPNHQAWSRRRAADHGGAKRMRKDEQYIPSGPHQPTPVCRSCPAAEEWTDEEVQSGEVQQDEENAEGEDVEGGPMEAAAHVNGGGDQTAYGNHVLDETIFDLQERTSSEEFEGFA